MAVLPIFKTTFGEKILSLLRFFSNSIEIQPAYQ
jgi:hypothetical protein